MSKEMGQSLEQTDVHHKTYLLYYSTILNTPDQAIWFHVIYSDVTKPSLDCNLILTLSRPAEKSFRACRR